jgi:hypothetical protein
MASAVQRAFFESCSTPVVLVPGPFLGPESFVHAGQRTREDRAPMARVRRLASDHWKKGNDAVAHPRGYCGIDDDTPGRVSRAPRMSIRKYTA